MAPARAAVLVVVVVVLPAAAVVLVGVTPRLPLGGRHWRPGGERACVCVVQLNRACTLGCAYVCSRSAVILLERSTSVTAVTPGKRARSVVAVGPTATSPRAAAASAAATWSAVRHARKS